jgi:hypothetical protein
MTVAGDVRRATGKTDKDAKRSSGVADGAHKFFSFGDSNWPHERTNSTI